MTIKTSGKAHKIRVYTLADTQVFFVLPKHIFQLKYQQDKLMISLHIYSMCIKNQLIRKEEV